MVFHTKVAAVWKFPHEELSARPGLTTVEIMQAAHAGTIKGMYIMAGIAHDRIQREGILWPCPDKAHPVTGTLFLESFNTTGGRVLLFPQPYAPQTEQADAQYPFLLNTGRILYQYHSCTMSRHS